MVRSAGLTATDCNTAGRTVNSAEFEIIDPDVAVMVVEPVALLLANPEASIVANTGDEEAQLTELETFCVEPSVKVPVAKNCCVAPSGMDTLAGVIDSETSTAGETVSVVCPDMAPEEAVMVVLPTACVLAKPPEEILAMLLTDDDQTAVAVRFCVLPSEYLPVAVN
jgi:hypothetical protein